MHNFKKVGLVILIRLQNYDYYYKTEYYDTYQGCEIGMIKTRRVPLPAIDYHLVRWYVAY